MVRGRRRRLGVSVGDRSGLAPSAPPPAVGAPRRRFPICPRCSALEPGRCPIPRSARRLDEGRTTTFGPRGSWTNLEAPPRQHLVRLGDPSRGVWAPCHRPLRLTVASELVDTYVSGC